MSTAQGNKLKITALSIRSVLTENTEKIGKLNKENTLKFYSLFVKSDK